LLVVKQKQLNYKPDLDEFITQCEVNYSLILKLLPFLRVKKNTELGTNAKAIGQFIPQSGHSINFELLEKAKYTTTLMLKLAAVSQSSHTDLSLMVRLYHDAQLLEVMDKVGPKALQPVIKGENLVHKQADEKRQLNRFLGESLKYCLIQ